MRSQQTRRTPALAAALTAAWLLAFTGTPPLAALEPVGEPFRLDDGAACRESAVDLARLADGGFVAVWVQGVEPDEEPAAPLRVHARLFDADGTPRGPAFVVDDASPFTAFTPAVAATGGGFLVTWVRRTDVVGFSAFARVFAADGAPRGATFELGETRSDGDVDVAATDAGYRLVWVQPGLGLDDVATRTVGADGAPSGKEILLAFGTAPENTLHLHAPRVAADDGGFSTTHQTIIEGAFAPPGPVADAFRFTRSQAPYDPVEMFLRAPGTPLTGIAFPPAVGTSAEGDTVVVWRLAEVDGRVRGLRARIFAADGTPRTAPIQLTDPGAWISLSNPALAVAPDGTFQVAWAGRRLGTTEPGLFAAAFDSDGKPLSAPRFLTGIFTVPDDALDLLSLGNGRSLLAWSDNLPTAGVAPCGSSGILAQRLAPESTDELLLHDDRFAVRVSWRNPYSVQERAGLGVAEPLGDASGWFWFFRPGNAELVVKILDGRAVNGHWWVFHGGLSTVAYEITVTDLDTGATWSYDKPPFERVSAADTRAFPAGTTGAARPAFLGAVTPRSHPTSAAGPCTDPSLPVPIRPGLCLHDRFEVEVELDDPLLHRDIGAEPLSADSGRLWFFRQDNTELLVKLLDGRAVNGHWWLFSGALTNVGYTLVVRDTESGDEQRYPVPPGRFESIADTDAFAGSDTGH